MLIWLFPVFSFLFGSVPYGLLISHWKGIDIRKHGSGNIGATNVLRIVGKKYGILCLFLDALKGYIPVILAVNFLSDGNFQSQLIQVLTALFAVLGHNYSPWIGFKGGKGIATSAGVLLALMPAAVGILILIFLIVFFTTRYVALASIVASISLPILTHLGARFHGRWEDGTWNKPLLVFTILIAILAVWKHRSNVQRLLSGTEHRFVKNASKKGDPLIENTMNSSTLRYDSLAITSLILGCTSLILGLFTAVPAIICGHISLNRIQKNHEVSGSGLALAGLILGYIFLVFSFLALFCYLAFTSSPT